MDRPWRLVARLCAAALLAVACAPEDPSAQYFPLSPTARWTYETRWTGPDGTSGLGETVDEVIAEETTEGSTHFKKRWFTKGFYGATPRISHVWKASDGVYEFLDSEPRGESQRLVPFPLLDDSSWKVEQFEGEVEYRVAGRQSLEVQGVLYEDCLRIDAQGFVRIGSVTAESYYAKGVGMIKQVERYANGVEFVYELTDYRP